MKAFHSFNILDSPIDGTNLIEASAGTGKTYTIAGLFLRLLLEKKLSVNEILVVTFTESATEELKDRIRNRLREAVKVFSGESTEDIFLACLFKKHKNSKNALRRLIDSVRAFDMASIFTIHGFCMRILHENTFESGGLFNTALITDQEELKREVAGDFWRSNLYNESPLFIRYLMGNKFNLESLISLFSSRFSQLNMKIIPQTDTNDVISPEKEFKLSFDRVSKNWQAMKDNVQDILKNTESLDKRKYPKAKLPVWIQAMDNTISLGPDNLMLFKDFEKFTTKQLKVSTKPNFAPPAHPFFDLCETLLEKKKLLEQVFKRRLLGLKVEFFRYAGDRLTKKKQDRNIQFFDDLLNRLYCALEQEGGENLAQSLRIKFKAALIDEFQDTDPVQYAIFRKIFGNGKSNLFLIGDPKQAIYSFRGADIFAYINASQDVKTLYTLSENWRADPPLITAINTIFSGADNPFIYDEIPFQPTSPSNINDTSGFSLKGKKETPFTIWHLKPNHETIPSKPIPKTQAGGLISKAIAAEISYLIDLSKKGEALLKGNPVRPGDIAVLVRKNDEARLIQDALSELNIPSVLHGAGNILDTHEATETKRVLSAVAQPNDLRLLRPALATDIIGIKGEKLNVLIDNEPGWEKWLVAFKEYHNLWRKKGFIQMFRYFLRKENVLMRLMSFSDGERRNTNMLHLSEILQGISVEKSLTMAGLLQWFSEQISSKDPGLEEHQLRLESDENAVKIITIHKSKGLEYPIVFCPFMWGGSRIRNSKEPFMFHNEKEDMRLTLDLGSQDMDKNRVFAEKEQLAENLRLFYVALTRAKNRCYIIWGRFNEAETSAPAYLFHQHESFKGENITEYIGAKFKGLNDYDITEELKNIADRSGGAIRLAQAPSELGKRFSPLPDEEKGLKFRKFSGSIDSCQRISSFSSLISNQVHGEVLKDYDVITMPNVTGYMDFKESEIEENIPDIFSFPKGARSGIFLHDVLEHMDFTKSDEQVTKNLIKDKLTEYGIGLTWENTIYDMLGKVISTPLDPENSNDLVLSCIGNQNRLNELQFYFPLKQISPINLKDVFKQYSDIELSEGFPGRIERLRFSPVKGFMTGFIDMVFRFKERFYLVDWKSNFLGTCIENYGQDSLTTVMEEEYYTLQYQIYTVALNQYLLLRLPGYSYERHFGGIFYIFLRGVDPNRGYEFGIYRKRPSEELIMALSDKLIDKTEMFSH
ncbi:MAG: exodeoxyribonuclease V subunit beta [Thermodesulfobacteriota bacterium]|nr:exodeoxyribonuclease V subunit beta [Thermodesulfobacteriota bacterium]